jgi:hypothetical protein
MREYVAAGKTFRVNALQQWNRMSLCCQRRPEADGWGRAKWSRVVYLRFSRGEVAEWPKAAVC